MSLQGQVQYSIAVTVRKDPRAYMNMTQDVESFPVFIIPQLEWKHQL